MAGDAAAVRVWLPAVRKRLVGKPVLYVPLSRGGRPDRIVRARSRERLLERLAAVLPRVGLVEETVGIVQLAKALESRRPPGGASVSEFDRVFEAATTALTERIVESAGAPDAEGHPPSSEVITQRILDGLSLLVHRLLETWMTNSRQLRLSVLERVRDDRAFATTRDLLSGVGPGCSPSICSALRRFAVSSAAEYGTTSSGLSNVSPASCWSTLPGGSVQGS